MDVVPSSLEALKKVKSQSYSLVVIEQVMPEIPGLEVIQKIKSEKPMPALLLTSHLDSDEIVIALGSGADDYLSKPFERSCLLNRVRSLLKRFNRDESSEQVKIGKLTLGNLLINTKTFDVFAGTERIQLTPSEFKLLEALALHKGAVLTRERLIELVQGQGIAVIDRAIDTHVFGLRKKLGQRTLPVAAESGSNPPSVRLL